MAAGRAIDLGGLQKELDGFKARVERWAQGACTSSEAARDAHFQRLREFQGARALALLWPTARRDRLARPTRPPRPPQPPSAAWSSSKSSCCGERRR